MHDWQINHLHTRWTRSRCGPERLSGSSTSPQHEPGWCGTPPEAKRPGWRRGPGHAPTPPRAEPLLGPPARATLAGAGLTQEGAGPSDGLRARHGRQLPFPPASDGGVRVGCHRPCGCWWPGSSARGRVAGLFQVEVSAISVPPVSLRGTRPLVAAHTRRGACSSRGLLPGPPFRESLCLAQGAASALTPSWRGRELSSTPSAQSHLVSNHLRV